MNLIGNPGFETDATGWRAQMSATITRVTSEAKFGDASLEVVTDGAGGDEGAGYEPSGARLEASANTTYTFRAWVKVVSGDVELGLNEHDADTGGFITITKSDIVGVTGEWVLLSLTFTTTATTTHMIPYILTGNGTQAITYYVDGIALEEGEDPFHNRVPAISSIASIPELG